MGKSKGAGENSKKAAGQARKADAAAAKASAKDREKEAAEAKEWDKGSKSNAKAEAAAAKAAEAARKKAEKDALLKEEEASMPSKPKGNAKTAVKKTNRGIDSALAGFNAPSALNASGIDNALDALSLTSDSKDKIDRHPERRFKAAYAAYEERRLDEMKDEKGLRRQQKIDQIRKEFEKHPDNPFNQVSVSYNATKEELAELAAQEKLKKEKRLAGTS
ncbi:DUF1014-domain-containing protein [Delitschia confertaspora ATCC 74209]|uniref:DUF1014-domain-containing protein n=1 Tax=Delitschia confertaspora ATCC 74209 TaxID=1513339 RepID=A0A9P4MY74_9PLEO|nr:DUF1014-domain-containing protein [Delitschia confertaspora ATCC 74209]